MNPMRVLFLALQLSIPVGIALSLAAWLPPWPAFGLSLVVAVLLSVIGTLLVLRAEVDQVTWRNRVAALMLPWGYRLAKGRLLWIGVVSAVVFTAITGGVILVTTLGGSVIPGGPGVSPAGIPTHVSWLLIVAWLVDGAALLRVVSMLPALPPGSSPARTLWKLGAMVVALLVGSIVLLLRGYPTAALWVAGGPPLAIGVGFGLFVLMLMTLGRNTRWN